MDDNGIVKYTSISKGWTDEDEENDFIQKFEPFIQRLDSIILNLYEVSNGKVVLDNIAKMYLNQILNIDMELRRKGHSIFEKGSILIDLDFYFINKMEKAINKLSILINVLERITIAYTLSETVNYLTNKAFNVFTKSFTDLEKEISVFSINQNLADVCVSNFSDLNNYEYYQPGDFKHHYESMLAYLSRIGAAQAAQDLPILVAPVIEKREENIMKNNDLDDDVHYML